MNIFVDLINYVIEAIGGAFKWVIDFLPNSPAQGFQATTPTEIELGYITWFIPFPTMFLHFTLVVTAIGFYYAYRIVARWLKVVRG